MTRLGDFSAPLSRRHNILSDKQRTERKLRRLERGHAPVRTLEEFTGQGGHLKTATIENVVAGGQMLSMVMPTGMVFFVNGALIVARASGQIIGEVNDSQATVDFGKAMTEDDWVLLQGPDVNGDAQVEWMLIGTLVEGTTYNVTRDVDGSGPNTWPDGAQFGVIGQEGQSRLQMVVEGEESEFAVVRQGATWDAWTKESYMSSVLGAIVAGQSQIILNSFGATFAGGAAVLNNEGQLMTGLMFPLKFTAVDSATGLIQRSAWMGMAEVEGDDRPSFRIQFLDPDPDGSNLIANPDLEAGAITDWTLGTDWAASSGYGGGQGALLDTTSTSYRTFTSAKYAVTAGNTYLFGCVARVISAPCTWKVEVKWYDAVPTPIGTADVVTLRADTGAVSWFPVTGSFIAPTGATQAEVVVSGKTT